jgi:hypothetical protein
MEMGISVAVSDLQIISIISFAKMTNCVLDDVVSTIF